MIPQSDYDLLTEYASLEGTEIGGYVCELLCVRDSHESHGMSEEFSLALDTELLHWLDRFKTETVITTTSEPQPNREVKHLVWDC